MQLIDFILNIDQHLVVLMQDYGLFIYVILFLIIFCETGLVVTPFLPGDSLIFACGTFAAINGMNIFIIFPLLIVAAILGDTVNYEIGKHLGERFIKDDKGRFINKKSISKTQMFFEKHGMMTIFFARFVPIIRTFAPFVAGLSNMEYKKFAIYNITGAITWITLFLLAGYFFGNIPIVKDNFAIVILAIIFISLIPSFIALINSFLNREKEEVA